MKTKEISIVIADDHPVFRQGLRLIIENDRSFSVLAEAGDGRAALDSIETHQPNIALLDVNMPEMNGFAVAAAVQEKKLDVEIVFLTMHSEEELFRSAMDLRIKGYVLKDSAGTDILSCLRSVAAGKHYVSPALSGLLLNRRRRFENFENEQTGLHSLTPTEKNILKLIAEEKTSKEIGEELFVSYRTVETHRVNIARKLNLRGSLALIKFAIANKSEL